MGLLATPATIALAATELHRLAATLAGAEAAHIFITQVLPSGADEVSLIAAGNFNFHSQSHAQSINLAIAEITKAANQLAAHAMKYSAEDLSFEGVQKAVESGINIVGSL